MRIFDGRRVLPGRHSILVLAGRIVATGKFSVPSGVAVHDGRGRTLLPGLIDSHVHTFDGSRTDALRFGVTTELEMFGSPAGLIESRRRRRSLRPTTCSDLWSAGNGVTVPGGHPLGTDWEFPRVEPGTDLDAYVRDRLAEGSDFVKLVYEPGNPPERPLPTLTAAQVRAIIAATHRRGRIAVAHVEKLRLFVDTVRFGADGIVHAPYDAVATAGDVRAVRSSGAFVVPTLSVVDWGAGAKSLLADQRVTKWLSGTQRYLLEQEPPERPGRPDYLGNASATVGRLHAAGVPILAGTDAPVRANVSGPSLFTELEHLVRAGLSPTAALTAATAGPADHFRLGDRGRIAPGRRADLLLVDGNPAQDITALRALHSIWKNGHPVDRTPVD
ncbi:amidohydrolase [Kribbella flavida DSM 17836]|uniref:Amidohydrolase n=1 Tax=Kribbella flavida (strain DSM 17836 / JCM 10339 / NBRC 14399) TaxID=479435 RepID=D2PRP6_KRIFD|nr:amidohydrolase [Kribbella flavida DSM 17836]